MRHKILVILTFLLVTVSGRALCQVNLSTKITYIGNEGVIIESGDKKVLIDGLHRKYKPAYLHLSDDQISEAEEGKPPFDNVDVLLITHIHRDHFSALSVGRYLKNNPETTLIASEQVVDTLISQFSHFDRVISRVSSITPVSGEKYSITKEGIEIEAFIMAHSNERFDWIQNVGFLVTLDEEKILHIGDAAMAERNFTPYTLAGKNIDLALLPYWYFLYESGQKIIRNHISARHHAAIHIDPREKEEVAERLEEAFPGIVPMIDLFMVFLLPD